MVVTIQKWGNSCALRLPKQILDLVGFGENTSVEVVCSDDGDSIMVRRSIPKFKHKTITERMEAYYRKPISQIGPFEEEKIDWGGPCGEELL